MAIYAFEDPTFQPAMRIISSITRAANALVTTSFAHDYITGTIVRFVIPFVPPTQDNPLGFGMIQINGMTGTITVVDTTSFTVDIDTTTFEPFSVPANVKQQAQVVAIGEVNELLRAAVQNVL